jgi:hypothetical protein
MMKTAGIKNGGCKRENRNRDRDDSRPPVAEKTHNRLGKSTQSTPRPPRLRPRAPCPAKGHIGASEQPNSGSVSSRHSTMQARAPASRCWVLLIWHEYITACHAPQPPRQSWGKDNNGHSHAAPAIQRAAAAHTPGRHPACPHRATHKIGQQESHKRISVAIDGAGVVIGQNLDHAAALAVAQGMILRFQRSCLNP